jgi:hypothetical protein
MKKTKTRRKTGAKPVSDTAFIVMFLSYCLSRGIKDFLYHPVKEERAFRDMLQNILKGAGVDAMKYGIDLDHLDVEKLFETLEAECFAGSEQRQSLVLTKTCSIRPPRGLDKVFGAMFDEIKILRQSPATTNRS